MDIAQLGFEIDSSPAATAAENLDKMTASAAKAESGTAKVAAQVERAVQEIRALSDVSRGGASGVERMVQAQLESIQVLSRISGQLDAITSSSGRATRGMSQEAEAARAMAAANEAAASGAATADRAISSMGETAEQQARRIHEMVNASLAAAASSGGIERSQRAVIETSAEAKAAVEAQMAAWRGAGTEQERMVQRMREFEEAEARVARSSSATAIATNNHGKELEDLLGKIDPVVRKLGELDKLEKQLRDARKAGQIGGEDYNEYAAKIEKARGEVTEAGKAMGFLSFETLGARRALASMVQQMAAGDFAGMQRSVFSLANSTGALVGRLAGFSLGIGSILAIGGTFVSWMVQSYREMREFDRAVIATGGSAGVSAAQIYDMAQRVGSATGKYSEATAALGKLASSGRLTADQLSLAGSGAVALATLTGKSADAAAEAFLKMADEPAKAARELDKTLNFLTSSTYAQVLEMERLGKTQEAATLAMREAARVSEDRSREMESHAGWVEKAWDAVVRKYREVKSAIGDLGRTDIDMQMRNALAFQERVDRWKADPGGFLTPSPERVAQADEANRKIIEDLKKRIGLNEELAMGERNLRTLEEQGKIALENQSKALDDNASKQVKRAKALEQVRKEFEAMRINGHLELNGMSLADAEAERIRQINEQYKDTKGINQREQALRKLAELERQMAMIGEKSVAQQSALEKENYRHLSTLRELAEVAGKRIEIIQKQKLGDAEIVRVQADVVAGINQERDSHAKNVKQIEDEISATGKYIANLRSELDVIGLSAEEREKYSRVRALENALIKDGIDLGSDEAERRRKEVRDLSDLVSARSKAVDEMKEIARGWVSIWESAGQSISKTFSDVLVNGGSLLRGLKDIAKQTVASIIEYFSQLSIINPILNGIFGRSMTAGGMSLLPTMANAGTGGMLDFTSNAAGGTQNSLLNPTTWINAGKSLWQGFSGGNGAGFGGASLLGTYGPAWQAANAGNLNMAALYGSNPAMTYSPSTLGYFAGGIGGLYAGIGRWNSSNGGIAGGLGALSYGIGTAGLIGGIGSLAAGGTFGAGLAGGLGAGAAAGAGMSGLAAAIPVVGWVALAAMVIDKVSGGKLFGTKGKLDSTKTSLDIGAEGYTLAQSYVLKGQKAFFGGTKWTEKGVTPTDEAMAAAKAFYDAILKNRDLFARQFNAQVGDLVGGTYRAEYDKNGDIRSQSVTVLGHEYKGETQEDLFKRLGAENMIAVLSQFDSKLSGMAEQYRSSVDSLTQFSNAATIAQAAIQAGANFLALGSDQTASSVIALADKTMLLGETVDQAVQRIVQAQAAYDQFVAQFEPAAIYTSDYEAALSGIYDQMLANIKQANELAKAAGAEAASVKDLANIHSYAAKQFAALRAQLEASAKSLAYTMGLIGPYTLDQVNSEIAALEQKAGTATSAINDFGGAMSQAATKANDALNLLLGNLSPLNDAQKLQSALDGLRAGTVSQQQVLEIGRRLYSSSQRYVDLFKMVQGYPGIRDSSGGSYSGSGSVSGSQGLSLAEQKKLEDLYKLQAKLAANQDYANAQTLARQVAEIAATDGVDYHEILKTWGLSAEDLAERLHLDSEESLSKWIENAQKQLDSGDKNTTILADLLRDIRDILRGTNGPEARSPGGRNGRVGTMTAEDADMIGESVARHVDRLPDRFPITTRRNGRVYSP